MTDWITGPFYEPPESAAAQGYAQTPPPFGQAFRAMQDSSTAGLTRAAERGASPDASGFDQFMGRTGEIEAESTPPLFGGSSVYQPPPAEPELPADEINKRFAPAGATITDKPMSATLGAIIGRQKAQEMQRESILARSAGVNSWPVNFGAGMAAFVMDPVNLVTTFIPGIGEEAIAAAFGRIGLTGMAARIGARAAASATAGAASMAPVAALNYGLGTEEASDYGIRDALRDVFYGAAIGAAIHAGIGGAREFGILRPDAIMGHPLGAPLESVAPEPGLGPIGTHAESAPEARAPPLSAFSNDRAESLTRAFERAPGQSADLAAAGFSADEIAFLHHLGVANEAGMMTPEQFSAWRDERELWPPEPTAPAESTSEPEPTASELPQSPTAHADAMRVTMSELLDGKPADGAQVVADAARSTEPPRVRTLEQIQAEDGVSAKKAAQIQQEEILARGRPISMDEYAARRAGVSLSPAAVVAHQQELVRNGYATGVPDTELHAATEELYGPKPAEEEKPKAAAPTAQGEPKEPGAPPKAAGAKPFATVPKEPERLASFFHRIGGMQDEGGDVRKMIGRPMDRPGLLNVVGHSNDDATRRAWEAGYFPDHGETRPSIDEMLEALHGDIQGHAPRYSIYDEAAVAARAEAEAHNAEINRLAYESGVDPAGKTSAEFFDEVADRMSLQQLAAEQHSQAEAHDASYREMERLAQDYVQDHAAQDTAHTAEEPKGLWDPEAFYGISQIRTLEDLEREHQQEATASAAGERKGGAAEPGPATEHQGPGSAGGEPRGSGAGTAGRHAEEAGGARTGGPSTRTGPTAAAGEQPTLTARTDLLGRPIVERAPKAPEPEQINFPGTEPSAVQAQAARDQAGRGGLLPTTEQKPADEGLFTRPEIPQPSFLATDPEMAEAEQRLAEVSASLSPEDRAEIAAATAATEKAEQEAAAMTEAASCLKGGL